MRPKQYLIDECDSEVIDYIEELEEIAEYHYKVMDVLQDFPIDIDDIVEA